MAAEAARCRLLGAPRSLDLGEGVCTPTSVAIARNGAFALVGCTDGSVRLAALGGARPHETAVLGQLMSRGLNNTLLVTCSVADDCRAAFAGAQKGATEVLAWDLSASWARGTAERVVDGARRESNADSKLRGFVACARAADDDYRLLCGRGIKNAHVWRVVREGSAGVPLRWSLIYDLPTNCAGSLVYGGFLAGAAAAWAKSEGGGVRLWRVDGAGEPVSEDVAQSKTVFDLLPTPGVAAHSAVLGARRHVAVGGA